MLLVFAGLAALESRAGRSSRAGALYEGAQEWQGDNVPLLHARAQELRRQGNQEVEGACGRLEGYLGSWCCVCCHGVFLW